MKWPLSILANEQDFFWSDTYITPHIGQLRINPILSEFLISKQKSK